MDHRVWRIGVFALLMWVSIHLLGCLHGPALDGPHSPMAAAMANSPVAAAALPSGAPGLVSSVQHESHCPDGLDHAVDRVRSDTFSAPAPGRPLLTYSQPASVLVALVGAETVWPDSRVTGRGVLTALCVART
ncbi:hypothetical protein [Streptomyces sp. G-G2]|uniref:hypothetical protein n=1 Tax=Streptomyces sp. G-G2 TaxID=3046201 RepID=UPI0024BAA649|nr:hypothetical protein [Streptomyces sp. G-G2]MDJ0382423.1 hypothetical protein [Streptomyces sp. G-G2]